MLDEVRALALRYIDVRLSASVGVGILMWDLVQALALRYIDVRLGASVGVEVYWGILID